MLWPGANRTHVGAIIDRPQTVPHVGAIIDRPHDRFIFIGSGDFLDLPKRKKNRLQGYDYSTPNAYFVTICTDGRKNLFWDNAEVIPNCPCFAPLNQFGKTAQRYIEQISEVYPQITVDHYAIMPNHVHLLLQINGDEGGRSMIAPTISNVVRHVKGCISKAVGFSVWQKGFYDHVIRNEADYQGVWSYIEGNPAKWHEDELCL